MVNIQFYPTPLSLATKMWSYIKGRPSSLLEPSAGRGDLLLKYDHRNTAAQCDVIEIDFDNQAILRSKGFNVVAHDFLTFTSPKQYDCIVMNPPFSEAITHVLHAWDNVLSSGQLVAVINAQTIKNPRDKQKQRLVKLLENEENSYEIVKSAFMMEDVQRTTNVEVAIISLHKTRDVNLDYSFLSDLTKDDMPCDETPSGATPQLEKSLAIPQSVVERAVTVYNAACKALRREIDISASLTDTTDYYTGLLEKSIIRSDEEETDQIVSRIATRVEREDYNERVSKIKERAWSTVLTQTKIGKSLSSSVMKDLSCRFKDVSALEFTEVNILSFLQGLTAQTSEMQLQMLADVHRSFTSHGHGNQLYFKGWISNNKHRVAFKIRSTRIILPLRRSSWSNSISHDQIEFFRDIDKAMDLLSGLAECTYALTRAIQANEKSGSERFSAGHWEVRMYSESIHLYPNDPKLIDTLNLWVGRHNRWLPPEVSPTNDDLFWKQYNEADKYNNELLKTKQLARLNSYRITRQLYSDEHSEHDLFNTTLEKVATEKGFDMNFRGLENNSNKQLTIV